MFKNPPHSARLLQPTPFSVPFNFAAMPLTRSSHSRATAPPVGSSPGRMWPPALARLKSKLKAKPFISSYNQDTGKIDCIGFPASETGEAIPALGNDLLQYRQSHDWPLPYCFCGSVTGVPTRCRLFIPTSGNYAGMACLTCEEQECLYWINLATLYEDHTGLPKEHYPPLPVPPTTAPAGSANAPTGGVNLPAGAADAPACGVDLPAGAAEAPAGGVGLPIADANIPAGEAGALASEGEMLPPPPSQYTLRSGCPSAPPSPLTPLNAHTSAALLVKMEVDQQEVDIFGEWDVFSQDPPMPSLFSSRHLTRSSSGAPIGDEGCYAEDLTWLHDDDVPALLAGRLVQDMPPLTPAVSMEMCARMFQGPGIKFQELIHLLRKCYKCSRIMTSDIVQSHNCPAGKTSSTLLLSSTSTPAPPVVGPSNSAPDAVPASLPSTPVPGGSAFAAYQTPTHQPSMPSVGTLRTESRELSCFPLTPFPMMGPSEGVVTPVRSSSIPSPGTSLASRQSDSAVVLRHRTATPPTPLAPAKPRKVVMRSLSQHPIAFSGILIKDLTQVGQKKEAGKGGRSSNTGCLRFVDKGKGKEVVNQKGNDGSRQGSVDSDVVRIYSDKESKRGKSQPRKSKAPKSKSCKPTARVSPSDLIDLTLDKD
ncbi:hypothetical protein DENSPDRAFT_881589 [Dentipellis sp. KUC8613]|nr:hypothetical protein DENSPDRAFT_881589 [Dentipellis sp. KUC8613]